MKRIAFFTLFGAIVLAGCTKEEKKLEVTPNSITVYTDRTAQLTTNVDDAAFSSSDEYYATVSENGLVTGEKVGETEIVVSSSRGTVKVPITIMSQYSLYPDVDGLVGKTLSDITKVMGSNYESSTSTSGEITYLYRNPTSYVDAIMFIMKGSVVETIGVLVPTTNTSMITKHLIERYTVAGMQNDMYFFLNHGKTTTIAMQVYSTKYIIVMYLASTASKSVEAIDLPTTDFPRLGF